MNPNEPTNIDLERLRSWIGRGHVDRDVASVRQARLMAATVDRPGPPLGAGEPLPPLWHWIYFLEGLPPGSLGPDGHPARGGFLPPVPLPNRMWAGGRVQFEAPILLGLEMEKRSQVLSVEQKRGRAGALVFVTVLHEVWVQGRRAIREEHDIVYKNPTLAVTSAAMTAAPRVAPHCRRFEPDSTMLFRYSALTFNGHRIHYDLDYCRRVEGYDNLVIHGPLSATMLAGYGAELGGAPLRQFSYRGLRPAFLGASLTLNARPAGEGNRLELWVEDPSVGTVMEATAGF